VKTKGLLVLLSTGSENNLSHCLPISYTVISPDKQNILLFCEGSNFGWSYIISLICTIV